MMKSLTGKAFRFMVRPGRRDKLARRFVGNKVELDTVRKHRDELQRQLSSTKVLFNAIRSISVNPYAIKEINKTCPFCGEDEVSHISSYPGHETPFFAKLMVGWCTSCGGGHVFNLPISLNDYYKDVYATENRKGDRDLDPAVYFSDRNPMWKGKKNKYLRRVDDHLQTISEYMTTPRSILDYGSGPGYLLWRSDAKRKYAVEPDEMSTKYLEYLGVQKVEIDKLPKNLDCIVASHVMEHIEFQDLNHVVKRLYSALSKKGTFLVEVPPGALLQKRYEYLHEPHTLFYSKKAMVQLMDRNGFVLDRFYVASKGREAEIVEPRIVTDEEQEKINASMVFVFKKRPMSLVKSGKDS